MQSTSETSSKRPSLKLNALSNFGGLAINVAVGFFVTPAMLNYLGEKRFGIWTLVSSLVGYFGLLEFGVGAAVFRYVPLFHGQGDGHRVSAVVSTSLGFYTGLSLLVVALTQLLAYPIAHFFGGGPEVAGLLRIIGLASALTLPAIVLNTATASYENFAASNLVGIFTSILRGALLFGCIWAGYGLSTMAWATVLVSVVSLVGNSIVFQRTCSDAQLSIKAVKWEELKMLLSFGSVILVVGIANSLATESPKQIVAKTVSLEELGLFSIPLLLIGYYRMLILTLTKVFSPRFSFLSGRNAEHEIRPLFLRGCKYMAVLAGAVAVLMWMTGPGFLVLWTKKPLIVRTVPALDIMVAGTFVFLSHRLGADLLFGLGRKGQVAILELSEAIGIVGLTIPLSLKFGIAGAGLGLAIPPLFVRGLLQTRFVCQALKLRFVQYYSNCIIRTWLVVAAMWGMAKIAHWDQLVSGWPSLILISALLMGVYGFLTFALVLESSERKELKDEVLGLFKRVKLMANA
jgi:O-antigen/teichoic acid export membrane protein